MSKPIGALFNPEIRRHGPGEAVKTVRIKTPIVKGSPDGFTEINEEDFDADKHELHESNPVVAPKNTVKQDSGTLRAAGGAASVLLSSAKYDKPLVIIKGEPVELADLIKACMDKGKLTQAKWNKLSNEEREALLDSEIFARS